MHGSSPRLSLRKSVVLLITCLCEFLIMGPAVVSASSMAEFEIGTEGRYIVVPVRIGTSEYQFLLDTAATLTGFDDRLTQLLGRPLGPWQFHTPGGITALETYECPEATVGNLSLGTGNRIFCADLTNLQKGSGIQFDGVLGFDFLRNHVVQVDFDQGSLKLLPPDQKDHPEWGTPVPMRIDAREGASIRATLGDSIQETFVIDTGAQTNCLASRTFQSLANSSKLLLLSTHHRSMTANGEVTGRTGRLQSIAAGGFSHRNLRFDECPTSAIGLRYLARYAVTFDFPNRTLYLKPGKYHSIQNHVATSGLSLTKIDGQFRVHAVHDQGPAAKSGIKPGDIFVRIEGQRVRELDMFAVGRLLTSEVGKSISATVLRDSELLDLQIVLEARHPTLPLR